MPYGVIVTQSILCSSAPREADHELQHASNSIDRADIPRRKGNKPSHTGSSSRSHENERAASGKTFAGVLRALLKPSSSPADASAGSGDEGDGEAPPVGRSGVAGGWQPRTALDLSGHSFSKALKAEINRSKEKKMALKKSKTRSMNNLGSSSSSSNLAVRDSWWEKQESEESWFSRVSSASTIPASPPELHQQHQQQRKPGPGCHARSFGDLDEMSLAVGLQ